MDDENIINNCSGWCPEESIPVGKETEKERISMAMEGYQGHVHVFPTKYYYSPMEHSEIYK